MQEEQPRRKPRTPLSPEELFYVKEIKKLKELKRIEDLQKSTFYKVINRTNIFLAAFISYCLLSILFTCSWSEARILSANCAYGEYDEKMNSRTISEIQIMTTDSIFIPVKTSNLFIQPQLNDPIFIGRDYIFNKILKVRLASDSRSFWHIYTYPSFGVCTFALLMGFFVYKVNKHLTVNGLLTVFGLFVLASLYFVLT